MECRDYQQQVLPFLREELEDKEVICLLNHVDECENCREELKIQFLVREGLDRLENGGNFNLQKDFEKKIVNARRESGHKYNLQIFCSVLQGICILSAILILLWNCIF